MLAVEIISIILFYVVIYISTRFIKKSHNLLFFTLLHPVLIFISISSDIFFNKESVDFNLVIFIFSYLIISITFAYIFDLVNLKTRLTKSLRFNSYLESNTIMICGVSLMILKFTFFNYGLSKSNSGIFNYLLLLWYFNYGVFFLALVKGNRIKSIIYFFLFSIEFFLSSSKGVILNLLLLYILSEIIKKGSFNSFFKPTRFILIAILLFSVFTYSWVYRYLMPTFNQKVNAMTILELVDESPNDEIDYEIINHYIAGRNEVYSNFKYQLNEKSGYSHNLYPNTILSLFNILPNKLYHALFGSSKVYFSYFTAKYLLDFQDGSSASSGKLGEGYYNYGAFFPIQIVFNYAIITLLLLLCIRYQFHSTLVLIFLFMIIRDDSIFESSFTIFWAAIIEFFLKKKLKLP